MKNKLLVFACAAALSVAFMTSCREKTNFAAICDEVAENTLKGYFSGAEMLDEDLVLSVLQFNFAEDGTVTRTVMAEGDGVYEAPVTTKFSSWAFGDYIDGNIGRKLLLYPEKEGEPFVVEYYFGGIYEEGQPMALDKNDKVKDIAATDEAILGKKWVCNDTVYHKIDTIINVQRFDTTYSYKPKKDPETGKTMKDEEGHVIYEQTIKSVDTTIVPTKMKWPVAPKTINIRCLELYRDKNSKANTGKWYMVSKAYDMDKNREVKNTLDTLSSYDFHWAYSSFGSTSQCVVAAEQDNGDVEYFELRYDFRLPSITLDKHVLKIEE